MSHRETLTTEQEIVDEGCYIDTTLPNTRQVDNKRKITETGHHQDFSCAILRSVKSYTGHIYIHP